MQNEINTTIHTRIQTAVYNQQESADNRFYSPKKDNSIQEMQRGNLTAIQC